MIHSLKKFAHLLEHQSSWTKNIFQNFWLFFPIVIFPRWEKVKLTIIKISIKQEYLLSWDLADEHQNFIYLIFTVNIIINKKIKIFRRNSLNKSFYQSMEKWKSLKNIFNCESLFYFWSRLCQCLNKNLNCSFFIIFIKLWILLINWHYQKQKLFHIKTFLTRSQWVLIIRFRSKNFFKFNYLYENWILTIFFNEKWF